MRGGWLERQDTYLESMEQSGLTDEYVYLLRITEDLNALTHLNAPYSQNLCPFHSRDLLQNKRRTEITRHLKTPGLRHVIQDDAQELRKKSPGMMHDTGHSGMRGEGPRTRACDNTSLRDLDTGALMACRGCALTRRGWNVKRHCDL